VSRAFALVGWGGAAGLGSSIALGAAGSAGSGITAACRTTAARRCGHQTPRQNPAAPRSQRIHLGFWEPDKGRAHQRVFSPPITKDFRRLCRAGGAVQMRRVTSLVRAQSYLQRCIFRFSQGG
jgi:hypothetical protein